MEQEWRLYAKNADFDALSKQLGISPMMVRIMRNRDLTTAKEMKKYLHGTLDDLYSPSLMKDMDIATDIIGQMKDDDFSARIAVASDYDCDGIFSGYILKTGLEKLGFDVKIYTPDRTTEGYGLNRRIVDEAINDERELLITCDNGIAAVEEVEYAISQGMTVIVTDHHEPQETLPPADAILDPKVDGDTYPFKGLCGAGVAYKLICSLYDAYAPSEDATELLEYVAIATIADVMELKDENRILVKYGLKALSNTKNKGLKKLLELQNLGDKPVTAGHIGFIIGPCFNSAGRISSVTESFELLEATTDEEAYERADKLKSINDERKDMTVEGEKSVMNTLLSLYSKDGDPEVLDEGKLPDVIVVKVDDCHESLVGIVASKIKERTGHPVIVFTEVEDGIIKGSGRSIESYNMFSELMECKDLMIKFGGHAMAAGMSLKSSDLELLKSRLNKNSQLQPKDFKNVLFIDIALPISRITFDLIHEFDMLAPFGVGNAGPLFAQKDLTVSGVKYMGNESQHLKICLTDRNGTKLYGIAFSEADRFRRYVSDNFSPEALTAMESFKGDTKMSFAYVPSINTYNGNSSIQLDIKGWV
ncbi:MAG: single-stranded-DNA-specific exonuclease RecJ [Eubacterium sp.]|nr:single-stranded-DNA-specific exonuclease RecJ [Eubacterium sp.]